MEEIIDADNAQSDDEAWVMDKLWMNQELSSEENNRLIKLYDECIGYGTEK